MHDNIKKYAIKAGIDNIIDKLKTLSEEKIPSKEQLSNIWQEAQHWVTENEERLVDYKDKVSQQSKAIVQKADNYVHDNPWQVIILSTVIGLLSGILVTKSNN